MGELQAWDGNPMDYAVAVWLHSKSQRTGSKKTKDAYTDAIRRFRWALQLVGLELDSDPARIADVAQAWVTQPWGTRTSVSANTANQRLAILSSFYAFSIKRGLLTRNPLALVERRPVQDYAAAQPLSAESVADALASIDRDSPQGKRDFALLAVAIFTGRRLSELAHIRWGDITWEKGHATVTFTGKGAKVMRDTLPVGLSAALQDYVSTVHGTPTPETVVWVSLSNYHFAQPLSLQGIADICQKHLGTSKVHATRHSFAHLMEQLGAPVSEIQSRLGHASLQTTSKYLASLRSADNQHGDALASLLGI
jgi:integrase